MEMIGCLHEVSDYARIWSDIGLRCTYALLGIDDISG